MTTPLLKIREKLDELYDEWGQELKETQKKFRYTVEAKKIRFEQAVIEQHRKLRMSLREFFISADVRHVISAPIIYSVIIPTVFLDVFVTLYQQICFRLYRIPRVKRSDYIALDRHKLAYLNIMEKLNCMYCGYANGVYSYAAEIASRTEQFWCPVKHARRLKGVHPRTHDFIDFGDSEKFHEKLDEQRAKCRACEMCEGAESEEA